MKTKMHSKAILALLLSVVMVISMIPATALPVKAVDYTDGDSFYYSGFDDTTKWTATNTNIVNGVATLTGAGSQLVRVLSTSAITKDFTLKFSIQLPNEGTTDGRAYIELGTAAGTDSTFGLLYLGGNNNRADRVRVYKGNTTNAAYQDCWLEGTRAWHDIQIDVSLTTGKFSVTADGVVLGTDFTYTSGGIFTRVIFRAYSSTPAINIKNVEIYTSDMEGAYGWTVSQQAALEENIGFTFSGTAGSLTGITKVRATVGDTVVTGDVVDGAYSVTLPVAASQMGETITLEGLNAEGTAVETKTYTVEEYLDTVSTKEGFENIAKHALNYGAAAAAYFNGTAVTAPEGLTLNDVPNARKGDNVTLKSAGATAEVQVLHYRPASAISGDYTVEFKYQLQNSSSNVTFKIGPGLESSKSNLWFNLAGDQRATAYHTNYSTPVTLTGSATTAHKTGVWHTFKVTVNSTNKTFKVWLDGTLLTSTDYSTGEFPCFSAQSTIALNTVTFTMPKDNDVGRTVMIDDFAVYSGDVLYYSDNFETFQPVTTQPAGENAWISGGSNTTLNLQDLENPVSGECTGVTANSATLLFEDQVKIRYKVTLPAGKSINDYTVLVDGEEPAKVVSAGNNTYYVYSKGINPQMYGSDFDLTVSDSTGTLVVNYCALDYIKRMYEKDTTTDGLKTLLKAMYNYYLVAKDFTTPAA